MIENTPRDNRPNFWEKASAITQIIYLIRASILLGAFIFLFPFIVVFLAPTLLRGLYDFQIPFLNGFWFSLFTFLFAWTVMITVKLAFFYGAERLNLGANIRDWFRESIRKPIIKYRLTFILVCVGSIFTTIAGAIWINRINSQTYLPPGNFQLFSGIAVGFIVAFALLFLADFIQSYFYEPEDADTLRYILYPFPSNILARARLRKNRKAGARESENSNFFIKWLKKNEVIGRGYFCYDKPGAPFQGGHQTAIILFLVFLFVYIAFGVIWFITSSLLSNDVSWGVPAIVYLPILASVICWGMSALTFFLDGYRIPVLLPIVVWMFLMSIFQAHYYQVIPREHLQTMVQAPPLTEGKMVAPQEVIEAGNKNEVEQQQRNNAASKSSIESLQPKQDYIIVVAADGGGIQAAAWTARVLTGLEEQCRKEFDPRACSSKIRLISSVSGGSVGAMYFVAAYNDKDKGLPPDNTELKRIVKKSQASSLSNVAWGLAYSDFLNSLLPVFPTDRGQELEKAWAKNNYVKITESDDAQEIKKIKSQLLNGLSTWRNGVREGWRPAVIFNGSVAETGERFLLSTSDIDARNPNYNVPNYQDKEFCQRLFEENFTKENRGSRNFNELFPCHDIPIATAARLSSSFPYVTPAGRARLEGDYRGYNNAHIVDGGYYDNYGIVSLSEWLTQMLNSSNRPTKVLVVQIRCNDTGYDTVKNTSDGWFYQLTAPLKTLYNVRVTGQRSRGDLEFEDLKKYWETRQVSIKSVIFNFRLADQMREKDEPAPNKDYEPPLSWHLSQDDTRRIEDAWEANLRTQDRGWDSFRKVLACYRGYDNPNQCQSDEH